MYIDLLAIDSLPLPPRREYANPDLEMRSIRSPPGLVIRRDFNTIQEAQLHLSEGLMPADGVITIEKNTLLSYRIKDPTVDLGCDGDYLVSGGSRRSKLRVRSLPGMRRKVIYECRLRKEGGDLIVAGYFPRIDKDRPNGLNVVSDVLFRLDGVNNDGKVLSRQIQLYSFMVRKHVYETADNMVTEGKLIIDVGSGRLQSRSFYETSVNSFLLCDPGLDTTLLPVGSRTWKSPGLMPSLYRWCLVT